MTDKYQPRFRPAVYMKFLNLAFQMSWDFLIELDDGEPSIYFASPYVTLFSKDYTIEQFLDIVINDTIDKSAFEV